MIQIFGALKIFQLIKNINRHSKYFYVKLFVFLLFFLVNNRNMGVQNKCILLSQEVVEYLFTSSLTLLGSVPCLCISKHV